jgi:hypothetical protein
MELPTRRIARPSKGFGVISGDAQTGRYGLWSRRSGVRVPSLTLTKYQHNDTLSRKWRSSLDPETSFRHHLSDRTFRIGRGGLRGIGLIQSPSRHLQPLIAVTASRPRLFGAAWCAVLERQAPSWWTRVDLTDLDGSGRLDERRQVKDQLASVRERMGTVMMRRPVAPHD